jgi:hypothetical protein
MQGSKVLLFDHLVRADKKRLRHFHAETFGGLEVDDQIVFVGCVTGRSDGCTPLRMRPA